MNMEPFATWDDEAEVWWISKTPALRLVTGVLTIDKLHNKLSALVPEMLETENTSKPLPIKITSFA